MFHRSVMSDVANSQKVSIVPGPTAGAELEPVAHRAERPATVGYGSCHKITNCDAGLESIRKRC